MGKVSFFSKVPRICESLKEFPNRALHIHNPTTYRGRPLTDLKESYIHVASDIPYLFTTLGRLIDHQAETIGDRVGYVVSYQNVRKTYYQLKKDVDELANGLLNLGLEPGDRIGKTQFHLSAFALSYLAALARS